LTVRKDGENSAYVQAKPWFLLTLNVVGANTIPPMRRLLSPVKHVIWYLSYHSGPRQRP